MNSNRNKVIEMIEMIEDDTFVVYLFFWAKPKLNQPGDPAHESIFLILVPGSMLLQKKDMIS